MLIKNIKYKKLDGTKTSKDFYFNLSKGEIIEMEISANGNSLTDWIKQIVASEDGREIMAVFKATVLKAYGELQTDGETFLKDEGRLARRFADTDAYSELVYEMFTDSAFAARFFKEVADIDIQGGPINIDDASQTARQRSESQMQGYKKSEPKPQQEPAKIVEFVNPEVSNNGFVDPAADRSVLYTDEELKAAKRTNYVEPPATPPTDEQIAAYLRNQGE